jgi:hypothetical protein
MNNPLTHDEQLDAAVRVARELMGGRDATKVRVRVSRGGTLEIDAEAGDSVAARHQWSTGRK